MNRRRYPHPVSTLTLGVLVSLAVHGGFFVYTAFQHIPTLIARPDSRWEHPSRPAERPITISLRPPAPPPPAPPPPKPPAPPKPKLDEYPEVGEKTGKGTASHESTGDRPLQAKQAEEDQPLFSKNASGPIGDGGRGAMAQPKAAPVVPPREPPRELALVTPPALPPVARPAEPPAPTPAPPPPARPPTPPAEKRPVSPQALAILPPPEPEVSEPRAPTLVPPHEPKPEPAREAVHDPTPAPRKPAPPTPTPPSVAPPQPPAPRVPPSPPVAPAVASAATGDGRKPGLPSSAVPARLNETDSDPFRREVFAEFRDGKLSVRNGRKARTTRPQFQFNAGYDAISLRDPRLVLKLSIDATGQVTNVELVRSSGSVELDQPTRVAAYNWWFEPTLDTLGHPVADVFLFEVAFR